MKTLIGGVVMTLAMLPGLASAQAKTCDSKRAALESEIAEAKAHNNAPRVSGLETALTQLKRNCSDASLRRASQKKVTDAEKRLASREHDLQKARDEGKSESKIADRQRKVDQAHADLKRAEAEAAP